MIRWVSSIKGDNVNILIGAPIGKENWLDVGIPREVSKGRTDIAAMCSVQGCAEKRKYRSTRQFEVGGCSMDHLKVVEAGLAS